jgi:DNA-binding LytR/AlgR family response regulator
MQKINFADIKFIESLGDYLKIYLTDKTVVTRETLSNIESKMPPEDFIRVHRSFIVSYDKIDSFTSEYLEIGTQTVPISRSYRNLVMARLENKK